MVTSPYLARPVQGTVRQTGVCATCGEPIIRTYRDYDWRHAATGAVLCYVEADPGEIRR